MAYGQHRNGHFTQHVLSDRTDEPSAEEPPAVSAHNDEIGACFADCRADLFLDFTGLHDDFKIEVVLIF